ncbi:hypothetical protein EI94DRAFT_1763825 [Lactarius quietus]|nr:hypothetical protein EI94DRAFT_1763825 [Lactarius quietus]
MSSLQGYVDRRVLLVLQDGRSIVGVLSGYDQKSNVVLSDSKERVYSMDEGVEEIPSGSTSILIGEIDEERDSSIDLSTVRADPIPPSATRNEQSYKSGREGMKEGKWVIWGRDTSVTHLEFSHATDQ